MKLIESKFAFWNVTQGKVLKSIQIRSGEHKSYAHAHTHMLFPLCRNWHVPFCHLKHCGIFSLRIERHPKNGWWNVHFLSFSRVFWFPKDPFVWDFPEKNPILGMGCLDHQSYSIRDGSGFLGFFVGGTLNECQKHWCKIPSLFCS